jgi:hypothetical protein
MLSSDSEFLLKYITIQVTTSLFVFSPFVFDLSRGRATIQFIREEVKKNKKNKIKLPFFMWPISILRTTVLLPLPTIKIGRALKKNKIEKAQLSST